MNWVSSPLPLDTHVDSPNKIDSKRVSAGMLISLFGVVMVVIYHLASPVLISIGVKS